MTQQAFAVFDTPKKEFTPVELAEANPHKRSDLRMFAPDFSASGVVDLRSNGCTALGKLLEQIAYPIMLVDQWFFRAFANSAFKLK